jgi:hypothetical protein
MTEPIGSIEGEIHDFNRKGIDFIKQAALALLISLLRPVATLTEAVLR